MTRPLMVTRLRTNDGRIIWMRRVDNGYPLLLAMTRQNLTIQALADKTRVVDPEGRGVSYQLVGRLVTQKASARETTTRRSAELIAAALGVPLSSVFSTESTGSVRTPRVSANGGTQNGSQRTAA